MPDQDVSKNKDLQNKKIREIASQFFLIIIGIILVSSGIIIRAIFEKSNHPNWYDASGYLFSAAITLIVANVLQYIRDIKLFNTINDTIADQISDRVLGTIRKIEHPVLPLTIFSSRSEKLRAEQIICFSKSPRIRFMSISAINLLGKTIPQIKSKSPITFELLFLSPDNEDMLRLRSEQIIHFENDKTAMTLKNEVLESIIKAYELCKTNNNVTIKIRLHDEIPFARIEFANGFLYLSFYLSQIDGKDFGPVAKYGDDSDTYAAYASYFGDVWDKNVTKELDLRTYPNVDALKNRLKELLPSISADIDSIRVTTHD